MLLSLSALPNVLLTHFLVNILVRFLLANIFMHARVIRGRNFLSIYLLSKHKVQEKADWRARSKLRKMFWGVGRRFSIRSAYRKEGFSELKHSFCSFWRGGVREY